MRPTRILRSGVDFIVKENARIISLNRPKALNALNHPMVKEMRPQLENWKERKIRDPRTSRTAWSIHSSDVFGPNLVSTVVFNPY